MAKNRENGTRVLGILIKNRKLSSVVDNWKPDIKLIYNCIYLVLAVC